MHLSLKNKATFSVAWKTLGDINLPSSRLRGYLPMAFLKSAGINAEIFTAANIFKYQAVVFQKCYNYDDIKLAHQLKKIGVKVIFDQCDNHYYNPSNLLDLKERASFMEEMVEVADEITVSTEEMTFLFPGKKCTVINDAIDFPKLSTTQLFKLKLKRSFQFNQNTKLKVVWFGSAGSEVPHFGMIDILRVLPILERINENVIPVRLTIISNSRNLFDRYLSDTIIECIYFEWSRDSFAYLLRQNDISIIPIDDNPFTKVKSSNRIITSLLNGLPVVADYIPSYEEFKDFILFADWEKSLLHYKHNKSLRATHVTEGKKFILSRYNNKAIRTMWENFFIGLINKV
jgi:hypothetical protein